MEKIQIAVGDWSGDGHGKCDYFTFQIPEGFCVQDVREAYFQSMKDHPDLDPGSFCEEYEDSTVPDEIIAKARKLGFEWTEHGFEWDGEVTAEIDGFADYVAWFIGLSGIKLTRLDENVLTLHFYGRDDQGRHISHLGYGLYY